MVETKEYFTRPTLPADIDLLAKHMRGPDRAELAAAGFGDAAMALNMSVRASLFVRTVFVPEGIACIYGVSSISLLQGEGSPWMLGTDQIRRHAKSFMRESAAVIEEMHGIFPRLSNVVDARNRWAVRWLRHAGFTIREPIPYGPEGFLFHPFDKEV